MDTDFMPGNVSAFMPAKRWSKRASVRPRALQRFPSPDARRVAFSQGRSGLSVALRRWARAYLAWSLGCNIAAQGYGVAEVHLEMDATQIGLRMDVFYIGNADHRASNAHYLSAQRGDLSEAQWADVTGAAKAAASLPIYTDARPGRSLSQIEAGARRLFRKMRREGVKPGALIRTTRG